MVLFFSKRPISHNTCVVVLVAHSCPTLCNPTDCTAQAPLSMGFSRQGHWSGLPCPSAGDLPDAGIAPTSLRSPARQVGSSPPVPPGTQDGGTEPGRRSEPSPQVFFPKDRWGRSPRQRTLVCKRLGKAVWLMVLHPKAKR